jgi:hypothetical protein
MTDDVIDLDKRRGMAPQVATDSRRLLADVEANERDLRLQRDALESQLLATPAVNWREAAVKARFILGLYAATLGDGDTQRRALVNMVLADFERLEHEP